MNIENNFYKVNYLQGQHWSGRPGVSSPPIRKTGKIREDTGIAFILGIKLTLSIAIDYIKKMQVLTS